MQVTAVNGLATFTGCMVSAPSDGYTLVADAFATDPPLPLTEAVSPAFAVTGTSSQLSLAASANVITMGDPVTLSVAFGAAGADRTIEVDASPDQATWTSVGAVTTDSSGDATLDRRPSSNAWYRATFAGAMDLQAAMSGTVRVVVRQTVLLRPADPAAGRTISKGTARTFTTTVRPIGPDLPIGHVTFVLYRWNGSSWALASSRTEAIDGDGQTSWTWTASAAGHWYVRTIADPTPVNANSAWSPVEKYVVQ